MIWKKQKMNQPQFFAALPKNDSKAPSLPLEQYAYNETRYRMLLQSDEARAEELMTHAKEAVAERWEQLERMKEEV